ncbi:MAG: DUF1524 domain-containing protein, partial [Anaerolineae bacterium]|nr:DUF1524 domain-containing protein [Anaerolineae bacterium]
SNRLGSFLRTPHKFEAFLIYFLTRVRLVRIHIENSSDVPMVFEVINDRGVRLRPYEVLKGKLLGQIAKEEIDPYHDIWQEHIHRLQRIDEREVDNFFRFLFRANYVDNRNDYRAFDGEYHKTIYEDKWNEKIALKQNPTRVKEFVRVDFRYYADLYARLLRDAKQEATQISPHLYFNDLNNQDRQFLLILSACLPNDPEEITKIRLVSRLFDCHFTLLQLTGAYDSNRFTESLISLNKELRNQTPAEIAKVYWQQIAADIAEGLGVELTDPFQWRYFKDASMRNMGKKFLKYYLARIDHWLAEQIGDVTKSYDDLVQKGGWKWGYHIEHILAHNDENLAMFASDEEQFYLERNRLGALLLLLGRDNQASQNEPYSKKMKTYSHSLLWNRTLHPDFYHKNKGFDELMQKHGLKFRPLAQFDQRAVEERQRLLFEITKRIWHFETPQQAMGDL